MLTYQQAVDLIGPKGTRKVAHETWAEWGEPYHADAGTGEHTACPPNPGYFNLVHESPKGHRPNLERSIDIRYHDTAVVTIHPGGCYTLRAGGYFTKTTRARIEEYSPCRWIDGPLARNMGHGGIFTPGLFSRGPHSGGPWEIYKPAQSAAWGYRIEFRDGMTVNSDGRDVDHIRPEV